MNDLVFRLDYQFVYRTYSWDVDNNNYTSFYKLQFTNNLDIGSNSIMGLYPIVDKLNANF